MKNKFKIGVIGLGYVGLPLSIAFSKKYEVTGYDINFDRVNELKNLEDITNEVPIKTLDKCLKNNLNLTNDISDISDYNIYIVTVPTPVDENKVPDLSYLEKASLAISKILKNGDIVIYESTVYPGCTEEVCVPILEKGSNLVYNEEFYCGYSPERINPGDKINTIDKIVKVTSGSNSKSADIVDQLYSSVISAGTYKTSSIKIAEASKVIENAQRDINISLMNELSLIFDRMNLDTNDVINAAKTKWNFLDFRPGLVGGHCIGVDPYYLVYKSETLGYSPKVISSGRQVNDSMGEFVAKKSIRLLNINNYVIKESKVIIMGATYKENSPDTRNTKIPDIYNYLIKNGINTSVYDPIADKESFEKKYGIELISEIDRYDLIILAVPHSLFKEIDLNTIKKDDSSILFDLKGFYPKNLSNARL